MSAYSLCKDVRLKRKNSNLFIPNTIFLLLLGIVALGGEAWAAAPPAPTSLSATMASSRQINLAWTDNATTETNYYVERSPNGTGSWTVVATLGANITSYQNTGLTQNTRYYYRVRCKAGSTYSTYSNTANTTTAVLAAPTALTATVASATQITLNWTDNTAYETQYSIERSPNGTSSWTVIGTVATNVTTTTNSGRTAGTAYYYRVRAYDSTNYSAYSNTANQTIRTIAASAGSNGTIAPSGTVGVANGSNKSFTMTPNSGYKIATVTVNGGQVATNPTYTFTNVTSNQTISATFSVNTFTITASAGSNGTISPSGSVAVNGGANQVFTMTPNSGYKIDTVTVDSSPVATNPTYTFTNVTAAHTISATFSVNTVTITASAGPNGTINPSGAVAVNIGANQSFTITPNPNYRISDVSVDLVSVGTPSLYTFPSVTMTHSIVASFAVNTFTINATAGSNGSISPSGAVIVNSGATPTFTASPSPGYRILDIQVDSVSVGSAPTYTFLPVTANHSISALFTVQTFTITAAATANGSITPSGALSVNYGDTPSYTIAPLSGYHISDVQVDGASVGTSLIYTFPSVVSNHTITASFSNTYPITASAGANGTISPSGTVNVTQGTNQTYTITPNANFHISDVIVDGASVGQVPSYTFSAVASAHSITASFATDTIISGGTITTDTTWTLAGSPYVVNGMVTVAGTPTTPATLTIEAGVVVKFSPYTGLTIGSGTNQGALVTQGTSTNRVTLTVNGASGNWSGITFNDATADSATILEKTDVQSTTGIIMNTASPTLRNSGVTNVTGWGMSLNSSNPVLDNVTISNSGGVYGIYLSQSSPIITGGSLANSTPAGSGIVGSGSPIISNCTVSVVNAAGNYGIKLYTSTSTLSITSSTIGNGLYLSQTGITPTITGNTFTNYDNSPLRAGATIVNDILENNTITGMTSASRIEVLGDQITQDTQWKKWLVPYVVISGTISVYKDTTTPVTLTIDPGVSVKFIAGAIQVGYNTNLGALVAQGTAADRITFTRNGTSGNWFTITFNNGTIDGTTVLENVDIQYSSGIVMNSASPSIRNSTITDVANGYYGLYLNASSPTIDTVTIASNGYGIYLGSSSPIITGGSLTTSNSVPGSIFGSGSPVISNYSITSVNSAGAYGVNLTATTSSLSIADSSIANGLYIGSMGITPTITGNTFTNYDTSPLHAGANIIAQILDDNTFTGMTSAGRIEVAGEVINRDTHWKQWAAHYDISGWVSVYKDTTTASTLTIDPGVILKFNQGGMQIGYSTVKGILYAKGTATSKILFTSNQATPTAGYWGGITFSGDAASSSTIEQVIIEYAGSGGTSSYGNIILNSSSPVIRNSIIRNSSQSGIYASSAQNWPVIIDSEITGNKWGVYSWYSNPYITNTRITGNTTAGVWNATTSMDVDARDNWWGMVTGPTYSGNSRGTGDRINDHVLYNPWLGQVPGTTLSITEAKVLPASMNPDGDYVTFSAKISSSATWTIAITDANSATVKTYSGAGTTINQKWYGDDSQSIKVADGVYYYKIDAVDAGGNAASSPQGLIMVSRQIPIAIMDPPYDNQMFPCGSAINITGTVADSTDFKNYMLDYGAGENPTTWTNLKTSTTSTTNGFLYAWNTSSLTGYTYTVRLTVNDNAGNIATETSRVRFLCIQNATASEGYISPNGDGVKDSTVISATFTQPSDWTITIKNSSAAVERTFSGTGTSVSQMWDGKDDGGLVVSDGTYTYQIDATGSGTSTTADPKTGTIVVAAIVSNVGISSNTINTQAAESSTVFFTINSQATVTFSMIPEKQGPTGTPVYQTGKVCAAGACSFIWDGKDNTGQVVPDEAYLFVLTVSDGTHSGGYSPIAPTGAGTVDCSQSTGFDPAKNMPMTVTYTPAQPARVNVVIDWGNQNFKILDAVPATPESHAFDWEGRNPSNKLLDIGATASCSVASLIRENHIITTGDAVKINELKTDPYMMHLSYGQFTRIKYTLSRDANVTLKLTSPSGAVITLVNDQAQTAGTQETYWNGLDPADTTGKNVLVTEEGDFMVSVQAVNTLTGTSSTTKANVRIGY